MKTVIGLLLLLAFQLPSETPQQYFERGMEYYQARQFDSSLHYFDRAVTLDPNFHQAYFRRAKVKSKLNALESAYEDYSTAIALSPQPLYYNNRGINLAIRDQMQKAIQNYDAALALDSTYAQALLNKGVAKYHLGQYDAACQNMQRAYQLGLKMALPFLEQECGYQPTTEP
ncbi:MAG: tetratricopeptide repeat protein [Bacteroidota bacterium]